MPTTNEQEKQVRRILLRMMLDLHALVTARDRPTEETLVNFAIRLGQYEGRPMDATEIAAVTTLPRTSVIRHLKAIEERGRARSSRVGRRVIRYIPLTPQPPEIERFYERAERIVKEVCRDLSKLDSSTTGHGI